MTSGFLDLPLIQNNDFIGPLNCREAVSNDDRRTVGHHFFNRLLYHLLRFMIDGRCCFIEYQNTGIVHHCANKRKELSLSNRKGGATLHHIILKPSRQPVNEFSGAYQIGCVQDHFIGHFRVAEGNIVLDRTGK